MLRTFSRLTLLVPTILLIVSVGLFVAVEVRMFWKDSEIAVTVHDPIPLQAADVQGAVWAFHRLFEKDLREGLQETSRAELLQKYQIIDKTLTGIDGFLMTHEAAMQKYSETLPALHRAEEATRQIQESIPNDLAVSDEQAMRLHKSVGQAMDILDDFIHQVQKTHMQDMNQLFAQEEQEGVYRNILSSIILLNGLVLIILLSRMALSFRRNAEVAWAMERYNALFGAALQSLHVGVLIRDMQKLERPVVFLNKAFTDLTGYDFGTMKDKKSDILFGWHTNPASIEAFHDTIRSEKSGSFNILVYRRDGSSFWSEWNISPVVDKTGKTTHFVSLITDVTALKQAQEGLMLAKEQAERASAVKTNFLATMSHEIRTPINGLLGVLDLLNDTPLSDEQRKYIDIAATSGKALHVIINDILDYAKMEAGKVDLVVEPFSLHSLLQDALDISTPLAQRKDIALTLEVQETVPDGLVSDMGRIRQVILNLLSNAIKFTDKGGVTLRVLHLLTQETGDEAVALLRFEVEDTGIGISAVDQDKLFKEFSQVERSFTRRFGGTGLGLAITRRLVEMMNGEIGVSSKPGQGSTFWFMLPLPVMKGDVVLPRTDGRTRSMELLVEAPRQDKAILLVEDNETNRLVASRYLEKAGFTPDIVVNGLEAVKKASEKPYDLILMDISMAEMDGLQATQHIRDESPFGKEVPIIALTAHVMPGDRERFLSAGMNDYLNKPLDYPSLVQVLVRWLNIKTPVETLIPSSSAQAASKAEDNAPTSLQQVSDVGPNSSQSTELEAETKSFSSTRAPLDAAMNQPDLDASVLRHLAEDLGMEVVWRVTGVFLEDSQKRIQPLLSADCVNDLGAMREIAHTLKSSSASCGVMRLSGVMALLERAAAGGDKAMFESLWPHLAGVYQAARAALEAGRLPYKS